MRLAHSEVVNPDLTRIISSNDEMALPSQMIGLRFLDDLMIGKVAMEGTGKCVFGVGEPSEGSDKLSKVEVGCVSGTI